MNLEDLTPAGASLRVPVTGPHGQVVASFTPTRTPHTDDLWTPFTRTNDVTRDGRQGEPFGQLGHGIEHEPIDLAERNADHTVQNAVRPHEEAARSIRAALRPGVV